MPDIAQRFETNPILRPSDVAPSRDGMKIECLLNPGVFQFDGKTWLLIRVAERPEQPEGKISTPILDPHEPTGIKIVEISLDDPGLTTGDPRVFNYNGDTYLTTLSHLRLAHSEDGIHFTPDARPSIMGAGDLETFGIEDCRVVEIDGIFYLTYTAVSRNGVAVGMISTSDWKTYHRQGVIFPPSNKDCAIFPERIGGLCYALHRPSNVYIGGHYIWLAHSPDIQNWGGHVCIARSRPGKWDSARVGAGGAPIRTERGWLEIYHGADENSRYCLGALLLDSDNPAHVIARSEEPIMEPIAEYEKTGFFGNVVFTNGHIVDGDTVTIYYGASDEVICGARFSIAEILSTLTVK